MEDEFRQVQTSVYLRRRLYLERLSLSMQQYRLSKAQPNSSQDACWSADFRFSKPKENGSSCSRVMTVDLPSLSYIRIGIFDCKIVSPVDTIEHSIYLPHRTP